MELFIKHLKERRKIFAILLIFIAIFFTTFAMYQLPLMAVLYPSLLCMVIGVIYMCFDYRNVREKQLRLTKIRSMPAALMDGFENEHTLFDKGYQDIIHSLQVEITSLEEKTSALYQDVIDYYTVWVHQIKTPIASMKLTLQNEDTALSRKVQSDLFRVEKYVHMVLTYLRLDSTTSDYVFKEHSVDRIIQQSVKKLSREFIGRKIALEYEPIEKTVVTDDKWLGFVLEQVLSNALKYTRKGSIKVYLSENTLCVADTGIGIAPEDLPRFLKRDIPATTEESTKRQVASGCTYADGYAIILE